MTNSLDRPLFRDNRHPTSARYRVTKYHTRKEGSDCYRSVPRRKHFAVMRAIVWKLQYGGGGARRRGRWRHGIHGLWLAVISWPRDLTLRNRCHAAVNQFREARLSYILVRDVVTWWLRRLCLPATLGMLCGLYYTPMSLTLLQLREYSTNV